MSGRKEKRFSVDTFDGERNHESARQPSGQPESNRVSVVTVEAVIMPENHSIFEKYSGELRMDQTKRLIAKTMGVAAQNLDISLLGDGIKFEDNMTLDRCLSIAVARNKRVLFEQKAKAGRDTKDGEGVIDSGVLRLKVVLDYMKNQDDAESKASEHVIPDIIDVVLDAGGDGGKPLIVRVKVVRENLYQPRQWLGGFRDKRTGSHYHHASTQTVPMKRRKPGPVKYDRDTQTIDTCCRSTQSMREQGTQMTRKDHWIDESGDRAIEVQPYFASDHLLELKEEKALKLQRFVRQMFAFRRIAELSRNRKEAQLKEALELEETRRKRTVALDAQVMRRMHPRTANDFKALHQELEGWRQKQTDIIKQSGLTPEEQHERLQEVLDKEVKLLQTIDRLKIEAAKENKKVRTKEKLEKMASPKEWLNSQGDYVEVVTPYTKRASELVHLYNGLALGRISTQDRIDVLLNVKYIVKEFDCGLTKEIVELINRERDMLTRGRSANSLTGLRTRLSNLFLEFIETPKFNPGAATFQEIPLGSVPPKYRRNDGWH